MTISLSTEAKSNSSRLIKKHPCHEAALEYLSYGWSPISICPASHKGVNAAHLRVCKKQGKVPHCDDSTWKQFQKKHATVEQINGWWKLVPEANVGVVMGEISGVIGIDVDSIAGEEWLHDMSGGDLPKTPTFCSGRDDAYRYLYAIPKNHPCPTVPFVNVDGSEVLKFLGNGAQSVMPPSMHVSKINYNWVHGRSPKECKLAPAPKWLLDKLKEKAKGGKSETVKTENQLVEGQIINEGGRNAFLFRLAGAMRRHTLGLHEIYESLKTINNLRCDPPLPDSEVHGIAKNIMVYEPKEVPPLATLDRQAKTNNASAPLIETLRVLEGAPFTDPVRLAKEFLTDRHLRGGQLILRHFRGAWYEWQGAKWSIAEESKVQAEILRFVEFQFAQQFERAVKEDGGSNSSKRDKPPQKLPVRNPLLRDVEAAVKSLVLLDGSNDVPSWIGSNPPFPLHECVFFQNGFLHPSSYFKGVCGLLPPNPSCFNLNALPLSFDGRSDCPQWKAFLDAVWPNDPDSIRLLQQWFGYCLTADNSQQKFLLLLGVPRSGKTLTSHILDALLGATSVAAISLTRLGTRFSLAQLVGKLLATSGDAQISPHADKSVIVDAIKSITGGDFQEVEAKHKDSVTAPIHARFMIVCNEIPQLSDPSNVIATRCLALRTSISHLGKEDTTLEPRLKMELPGIAIWALEGLEALRKRGRFEQPASGQSVVDALRIVSNPIHSFIDECCILGPNASALKSDLFNKWRFWSTGNGHHADTSEAFFRRLKATIPGLRESRPARTGPRPRSLTGIALLS